MENSIKTTLSSLCDNHGLGNLLADPQPVTGGTVHAIWKVSTDRGNFAIKQLHDYYMHDPDMYAWFIRSEHIAHAFKQQNIPAVSALHFKRQAFLKFNKKTYLIFPYIKGNCIPVEQLTPKHTLDVGTIFSAIHNTNLKEYSDIPSEYEFQSSASWESLIDRYNEPYVTDIKPAILDWNNTFEETIPRLNKELRVSHGDLHPYNVIWDGDTAHVIDWEAAGLVNPLQEMFGFGLEWSVCGERKFYPELYKSLTQSYFKNLNFAPITKPEDAFIGYIGRSPMGWLHFNLRRALGMTSHSQADQKYARSICKKMASYLAFIKANEEALLSLMCITPS